MRKFMSLQMIFVAAVVSTCALAELHAVPRDPIGLSVEQDRRERVLR